MPRLDMCAQTCAQRYECSEQGWEQTISRGSFQPQLTCHSVDGFILCRKCTEMQQTWQPQAQPGSVRLQGEVVG